MDINPNAQFPIYIGIDGGGSKCKATLVDNQGHVLGSGISGPANPFHSQELTITSIIDSAEKALLDANLSNMKLEHLIAGIGLAGVNLPSVFQQMSQWQHPFAQMHLTTDLLIACLGAHQGSEGAIIITGTGSCGYSYVNGKELMLGGHGFPHGDKGSGAWFGLQAVEKVLLSLDGLALNSLMNKALLKQLACETTLDIVEAVAKQPASFYGKLASIVFSAAEQNDKLALSIIKEGAGYISHLARRLHQENPPRMSSIGGLNSTLIQYLDEDVAQRLSPPLGEPEIGAALYAKQQSNVQTA